MISQSLILILTINIVAGNLVRDYIWPKTDISNFEVKNVKYLYPCFPPDSEICGRANKIKIMPNNTFDCYEEVNKYKF